MKTGEIPTTSTEINNKTNKTTKESADTSNDRKNKTSRKKNNYNPTEIEAKNQYRDIHKEIFNWNRLVDIYEDKIDSLHYQTNIYSPKSSKTRKAEKELQAVNTEINNIKQEIENLEKEADQIKEYLRINNLYKLNDSE